MRCIIIEDQPPAQRILQRFISDFGALTLLETFGDAIKAIDYLNHHTVDLIFLDIHLPKLTGIEFLKGLKEQPAVILTTAYPDFALEGYELDVVDYLLKPFSFARFVKAVNKAQRSVPNAEPAPEIELKSIFIKSGYEFVKVEMESILYIKSDRDYTEIILEDSKLLATESLKHWMDEYPDLFIRIHKSYLINRNKILKISSSVVTLQSADTLPIGRAYKDEVHRLIHSV